MTIVAYINNLCAWYPSATGFFGDDTLEYIYGLRPRASECVWIVPGTEQND